jgi:aerobic carbon-monoxide dehydrogenase medium subunit
MSGAALRPRQHDFLPRRAPAERSDKPANDRPGEQRVIHGIDKEGRAPRNVTQPRQKRAELPGTPPAVRHRARPRGHLLAHLPGAAAQDHNRRLDVPAILESDGERRFPAKTRERLGNRQPAAPSGGKNDGEDAALFHAKFRGKDSKPVLANATAPRAGANHSCLPGKLGIESPPPRCGRRRGVSARWELNGTMYPAPFRYHRAKSLAAAVSLLQDLGEEAKVLAGGQSLIPLMKLRLARPAELVDLNFIPGLSYVEARDGELRIGALARHAEIENAPATGRIPILHDCASGIADVQVRNRGTIGGSLAEADPSGDWAAVLLALGAEVRCLGPAGERSLPLGAFLLDAYTTALGPAELLREVIVKHPGKNSGGAYLAVKRSAPVYATAAAAVQLTMADAATCERAEIVLGCVGLLPIRAAEAAAALLEKPLTPKTIQAAGEAAMAAADPQPDLRGTKEYKRLLVGALVRRAIAAAARRARGETVELSHDYTGRN